MTSPRRPSPSASWRVALAVLTGAGAIATVACGGFTTSITNRQPLAPLPVYAAWWAATESCSSLEGELGAIRWYTATGITADGAVASGMWTPPHDIILVLGYQEDERVVRHEMLHDLLRGDSGHESTAWHSCGLLPG